MTRLVKSIAVVLFASVLMMVFLSIGMGHWMSMEPMHHGSHECCDFVPMQGSTPPSTLLVLFPILAAIAFAVLIHSYALPVKQFRFEPFTIQPYSRRFLKGVVQRE